MAGRNRPYKSLQTWGIGVEQQDEEDARILELVNEFVDRVRDGENLSVEDYCAQHPQYAEDLAELLPALDMLEDLRPNSGDAPDRPLDLPDQIGDYLIIAEIGRGGMGVVYEAEQLSLRRRVALKVLPNVTPSEVARVRFQREARAAARLHHTNIVPVFEVGQEGDQLFYAMQLIQGQGLDVIIDELKTVKANREPESAATDTTASGRESGVRSTVEHNFAVTSGLTNLSSGDQTSNFGRQTFFRSVAELISQAASGLEYAHERSVIHRDIKPSNLLLDPDGVLWITDFGLAKTTNDDATLTNTGDYLGTLRYMSPERFRGECELSADVYALGITLYEFVLQQPAFEANDRLRLIYQINNLEPRTPRSVDARVPRDLETIILKSIDKDPAKRYLTAEEFSLDLHRFINDEPIAARRLTPLERLSRWSRRNRSLAAAIAGVVVLLIVMAVGAMWAAVRESGLRIDAQTSAGLATSAQKKAEDALVKVEEARRAEKMARQSSEAAERRARAALGDAEAARNLAEERRMQVQRNSYHSEFNLAGRLLGVPGGRKKIQQIVSRWKDAPEITSLIGWEWYLLSESTRPDGLVVDGIEEASAVEWSHDGKFFAVASEDGITIIDANTGSAVGASMKDHTGRINAIAWQPKGTLIAAGTGDSAVKLWNVSTRKVVREISDAFEGSVSQVAWGDSGNRLAFSVDGAGIFLLDSLSDPDSKPELLPDSPTFLRYLEWSPDKSHLAAGTWFQNWMSIYDITSRQPVGEKLRATRFIWDGQNSVATKIHANAAGRIDILDGPSGLRTKVLMGHTQWARTLDFSPDYKTMVSGGSDQKVHVWNLDTGRTERTFAEHEHELTAVRFSPTGKQVVSISNDSVRLWDTSQPEKELFENSGDLESRDSIRELRVSDLAWHPDGNLLASSSFDGYARIWDVAQQRLAQRYDALSHSVAWSPNGERLAIGSTRGLLVADPTTSDEPRLGEYGGAVDWNANGSLIGAATGIPGGSPLVRVFEYPSLKMTLEWAGQPEACAWHPHDPTLFVFHSRDHLVVVKNGEITHELPAHGSLVREMSWSHDGSQLATGGDNAEVKIYDIPSGQHKVLNGHNSAVWAIDWHPGGKRVASGSTDGTIRIWETESWQETLTLSGGDTAVSAVAWSPDGRRLATGNQLGQIFIWDAGPSHR